MFGVGWAGGAGGEVKVRCQTTVHLLELLIGASPSAAMVARRRCVAIAVDGQTRQSTNPTGEAKFRHRPTHPIPVTHILVIAIARCWSVLCGMVFHEPSSP